MRARIFAALLLLAAVLAPALAQAAERVGRTHFELPGWTLVTRYETKLIFNAGEYSMPLHHALYQLPGEGKSPRALLLVSSTEGGNRENVNWITNVCPPPARNYYTRDFGGAAVKSHRDCLVVNSSFAPEKFFKPDSEVVRAMESNGLEFPRRLYSIRNTAALRGGTLLTVNLMPGRDFAGLPGVPATATDVEGVPSALIAWGEALHAAVNRSVLSLGGSFELPTVTFSR
ncbi:MAG: hypothetical protein JWP22_2636 [Ramlibacter sp.]|jgi:hypothetical protein|nr:hypothetical protein [Ramlibacter sp.]